MAKLYARKSDGTYVPYNPQSVTNIDVVQTTGTSVTAAMSQDAVTKELATKQGTLTPSNGISIEGNVIGVTTITESESQPDTSLWLNPSEDEETDVTYNRSQIDAIVGAKQDALQLTVKDNGNIVLSNIQGQSKEFMPATPSGDPMHYAYEAAGAEYNDTGADIIKTTPWADLADDDADKTVVHKAGYWYLNGLGDLTNSNMTKIYALKFNEPFRRLQGANIRTCIPIDINKFFPVANTDISFFGRQSNIEIVKLSEDPDIRYDKSAYFLNSSYSVKHIITALIAERASIDIKVPNLITVKLLRTKYSVSIPLSANLSVKSVLYMINNEEATSPITITLHADAYARAMANADIVAALEAHPNVSLASA